MPRYENGTVETSVPPPPPYHAVRAMLREEYRDAEPEVIESILDERFPGVAPEYVEDFSSWLRNAGQTVSQYAPGVVQGAAQGAAAGSVAGPWGALIGALGGGALSALQGPQPSPRPAPAPAPTPGASQVPGPAPVGAAGNPAAQLLGLLNNPAVLQAVMSIAMGQAGSPTVQAGGQQIPVGNVLNTLGSLVNRAAAEYQSDETEPDAGGAAWPTPAGFAFAPSPHLAAAPQPPYVIARPVPQYEADLYDALDAMELAYDEALS